MEDIVKLYPVFKPTVPQSWAHEAATEIESLRAQLAAANAEVQEQARLNGMGSEREAKLLAQLAEERQQKHEALHREYCRREELERQLLATQAHAARLKCALEDVMDRLVDRHEQDESAVAARAALSTPINLDALHEDRARTLEEAKRRIYSGEFDTLCAEDAIQCIADELRAKKEGV